MEFADLGDVFWIRKFLICTCVSVGFLCSISAMAPATCGAAMLVPLLSTQKCWQHAQQQRLHPLRSFAMPADAMSSPGAASSGFGIWRAGRSVVGPRLENADRPPPSAYRADRDRLQAGCMFVQRRP